MRGSDIPGLGSERPWQVTYVIGVREVRVEMRYLLIVFGFLGLLTALLLRPPAFPEFAEWLDKRRQSLFLASVISLVGGLVTVDIVAALKRPDSDTGIART
jgi:hypothetical protein